MMRRSLSGWSLSAESDDWLVTPPQADSVATARARPTAPQARRPKREGDVLRRLMVSPLFVSDLMWRTLTAAVTTVTIAVAEHVVVIVVTVTRGRPGAILSE